MKIGLIGCGKMGAALLKGVLAANTIENLSVSVFDTYLPLAEKLKQSGGQQVKVAKDVEGVVTASDAILLCVKPGDVPSVLKEAQSWEGKLLLSIAAGVTTSKLEEDTQSQARVIRVMPNTPALIGEGASAYCQGTKATADDMDLAQSLLSSVGIATAVSESLMDAVTGISGSGPAYVYTIIEALSDAGVKQGLPRQVALELACQTLKGAAMMVQETGEHPAALRDQVTSPGGTTIAGLAALEEAGLRASLMAGVEAATTRSKELGS